MARSPRLDLIAVEPESDLCEPDLAGQVAGIFNRLARQLREARELRRENESLRSQNDELREALAECVDSCGRFLAPTFEDHLPEDGDRARAIQAIQTGRGLLARRSPPALPD